MAADFPDGVNTAGPTIAQLTRNPTDYEVDTISYEDGGADVNVQPCGLVVWAVEYEGLTAAEVTTLRTHFNDARSSVEEFNFYDRNDATLYPGVKYKSFRVGKHLKTWSNMVSIELQLFM